jgi:HD superfamily phosphohydrolase YqeK
VDPEQAESAGWLHDLGRVYSKARMLETAKELGIEVITEEEIFPSLLHQKL